MRTERIICLVAVLSMALAVAQDAAHSSVHSAILREIDTGIPSILHLSSGRIIELEQDVMKTHDGFLKAFKDAGDLFYDNAEGGAVMIASGECALLGREQIVALEDARAESFVERKDVVRGLRQGDCLLVKAVDGAYALLFFGVLTDQTAEIRWILTPPGGQRFAPSDLSAFSSVLTRQRAAAVSGVSTVACLRCDRPSVFSFADGKVVTLSMRPNDVQTQDEQRKYDELLRHSGDAGYDVMGSARMLYVSSRRCAVLGNGWLADFADRDLAKEMESGRARDVIAGGRLVPGTIIVLQDRTGNYALMRIENADTENLKFQWAYMPDGSAVFPKIAPLPDAVPATPEIRDLKTEAQSRLMRLVYGSAEMADADVRTEFEGTLGDGVDVNMPLRHGYRPLTKAASLGSRYMVELLIEEGAAINDAEALHVAAQAGRKDICELLLAMGADRTHRDAQGKTAFEVARDSPRATPEVLQILRLEGEEGRTLHSAALLGDTNLVAELIAQGEDVNAFDSAGKTPLHHAVEAGRADVCRMLLAAGADPEKGTQARGFLPLSLAVRTGPQDVAAVIADKASQQQRAKAVSEAFLGNRPDIAETIMKASRDVPALYEAAREDMETLMLSGKGNVLYCILTNSQVALPLWTAAAVGDTNAISKSLGKGANTEEPRARLWEETSLQVAARLSQNAAAKMLLDAGANPNLSCVNRDGTTPLLDAANAGNDQLVVLLLQHQANANLANNRGQTPLYAAVRKGHAPIVRLLLDADADPNNIPALRSEDGKPVSLLDKTQDPDIIELLRSHGAK